MKNLYEKQAMENPTIPAPHVKPIEVMDNSNRLKTQNSQT